MIKLILENLFFYFVVKLTHSTFRSKIFTFLSTDELVQVLKLFGYMEDKSGKTSGSAVRFIRENSFSQIRFHKPHPQKIIKRYILQYIKETLESEGLL